MIPDILDDRPHAMTGKNDGGAAFPYDTGQISYDPATDSVRPLSSSGMSLRDWFAGQALMGLCAHGGMSPEPMAKYAYQIADAMLTARETDT